jgi:hypothetical protein
VIKHPYSDNDIEVFECELDDDPVLVPRDSSIREILEGIIDYIANRTNNVESEKEFTSV